MSAPTGKPIWINPCGGKDGETLSHHVVPDQQLLTRIILSSQTALVYAKKFSSEFVTQTFPGRTVQDHHQEWKDSRYDWLPAIEEIPKTLGEPIPEDILKNIGFSNLSVNLLYWYRYLQTFAVGLEQIHHDKSSHSAMFAPQFAQIMFKLRQVLCEVESAIAIRNPDLKIVDVTRDVMSNEFRHMRDATYKDIRDWIIFRDFMNCLEFIIDVCEYYKKKGI